MHSAIFLSSVQYDMKYKISERLTLFSYVSHNEPF